MTRQTIISALQRGRGMGQKPRNHSGFLDKYIIKILESSVKYVSGGNPQPQNGKVTGHICDGKNEKALGIFYTRLFD